MEQVTSVGRSLNECKRIYHLIKPVTIKNARARLKALNFTIIIYQEQLPEIETIKRCWKRKMAKLF